LGNYHIIQGEVNWPEDLYKAPVYGLTHEKRETLFTKGSTTFYFTDDKIENVLEKAKDNASGKDIRIQGSANIIQQHLAAGLVGEFIIHIAPVSLGRWHSPVRQY
jgi:dihydrofolate reductase